MYRQYYRANKFNNKRQVYNGSKYMSQFEADFAQELDERVKNGEIKGWTKQFRISIDINGYHITNYFVDFCIEHLDQSFELVETKGFETALFIIKKRLLEAVWLPEHPEYIYSLIYQKTYYNKNVKKHR